MVSKARYSASPLRREVLGDGRGERRLAVVDVPDGAHVDVGLGALELLLGHRGCLTTPVQGFASRLGLGMEPTLGFEPKTSSLPRKCSAAELCGPGGHDRIKGVVGREGIEPPQSKTADLQSAELTTCSTYPRTALTLRDALPRGEENDLRSFLFSWSRRRDSNPEPAVYKTAALPIELRRRRRGRIPHPRQSVQRHPWTLAPPSVRGRT